MTKKTFSPLQISLAITPIALGIALALEWFFTGVITLTTVAITLPITFILGYFVTNLNYKHEKELNAKNEELQKTSVELEKKNTTISKQNAELDAFAQTIAHELKTPLGVIIGYSHLLDKVDIYENYDRIQQVGKEITKTSLKMNTIIQEMLLMAKLRQIDEIKIERLDMGEIVAESITRLGSFILETQAEIITPKTWLPVKGYAPWVEKVWDNYLSNAIKYGGENPKIELGVEKSTNGQIRFWVKDYGRGMTPKQQEKAFKQFTRFNPAEIQGHGLGLSITHHIIEKLGGEVGVESEIKGTPDFDFTLPSAG